MSQFWKFGAGATTEGEAVRSYLGGKGVGLVEMARQGLPVPPGIIIPTVVCPQVFSDKSGQVLKAVAAEAKAMIIEGVNEKLFSVRSGAAVSMPGMMDTILNVGIHINNIEAFQKSMGAKAALDCFRRLVQMYGVTVAGIEASKFHAATKEVMTSKYGEKTLPKTEADMNVMRLERLLAKNLAIYYKDVGDFPSTLESQLEGAIGAVFNSWNSERAIAYRIENKIPHDMYTACIVQQMVFGNLNAKSCSGVLFSRDPSTGEKKWYGDFCSGGQGEEVVSGSANTKKIAELPDWNLAAATELFGIASKLELQYRNVVDTEFTIENGKVYMLQVRVGKVEAPAAFRIAYELVQEGVIEKSEALKRVSAAEYVILSRPQVAPSFKGEALTVGVGASKGVAVGRAWLSSKKAQMNKGGILVSKETTPDDFAGMAASVGILTSLGGATSHAAVVARAMNRACVVGCSAMIVGPTVVAIKNAGTIDSQSFKEGDVITIDGSNGKVYSGAVPMVGGKIPAYVNEMIEWGNVQGVALKYDASKDTMPDHGEIYVSMRNLKTAEEVQAAVHGLDGCYGILSFTDDRKFDDSKFLDALCLGSGKVEASSEQRIGLESIPALKAKKWTVLGVNQLANPGFMLHKKLKTLGELAAHDGYYELDEVVTAVLANQGLSTNEFVALLNKGGKNLTPITKPTTREALAFQVFGK